MKRALSIALSLLPVLSSARAFASADTRLPQGATFAVGGDAAYLLKPDGTTWAWGSNSAGQVGDGTSTTRKNPVQISINCTQISAGLSFALCIAPDNTLYSWGINGYGQLGRTGSIYYPASVSGASDWRAVAAGYDHGLGIRFDGTLYAWGNNADGALGLNDTTKRTTPTKVGTDSDWIAVAAGHGYSLALKANGTLYGAGNNSVGQQATGNTNAGPKVFTKIGTSRWKAISAGLTHVMAIKEDGSLYVWGGNANGQVGNNSTTDRTTTYKITAAGPWRSIAAGWYHSVAIAADGTQWAWGNNTHGELGLGNTTSPQKKAVKVGTSSWNQVVAAGKYTTMLMQVDGSLLMSGAGTNGVLGVGTTTDHTTAVTPWASYDGDGWFWGNKPQLPGGGTRHSLLVGRDGMLREWGYNGSGQFGRGNESVWVDDRTPAIWTYDPYIFASASEGSTHGIRSDGTMWGWGTNLDGELGIGDVGFAQLTPAQVGTSNKWVKTAEHYAQMIAMQADGTLWSCGDNFRGLLGIGVTDSPTAIITPTKVVTPSGKYWAAVAVSEDNGYGIMTDGTLWAWGDNDEGQLGRGTKTAATGSNKPVIVDGGYTDWVAIGAGLGWAVGVRANGQAYTFGGAPNGASNTPKLVAGGWRMALLGVTRFSVLAAAPSGAVIGWGRNEWGELGMDFKGAVTTVQQTDYWSIRALAGAGDSFIAVDATDTNGHASGPNSDGQLGDGTVFERDYPVAITYPFSY